MAKPVEKTPVPLAILISGRGSNMRAIGEAVTEGRLRAVIRVVVSNRADAAGLQWAREAGLETVVLPHNEFESRDAYTRALVDALQSRGVKLVTQPLMRSTSDLRREAISESSPAARWTSAAPAAVLSAVAPTDRRLVAISSEPRPASCTLRAMSAVVAACSSTALAMVC